MGFGSSESLNCSESELSPVPPSLSHHNAAAEVGGEACASAAPHAGRTVTQNDEKTLKLKYQQEKPEEITPASANHLHQVKPRSTPAAMATVAVTILLLPLLTSALPFQQKGFWDFGKDIDVKDLLMTMMKDQEEGSAYEELPQPRAAHLPLRLHLPPEGGAVLRPRFDPRAV
ncbi:hypothetical protein SRHO_G00327060 [Serrasalmus rhombeus]